MDATSDRSEYHGSMRSPGAILAAERTRQGLAVTDIAQRLHMSASQVEALEAADYSRLPRGTFLRGFTRNYARALGLDAESLVSRLAEDAPRETAPAIVVPSQNIRFDPLGQRLSNPYVKAAGIATALIALGFAAMYWWLFVRPQGLRPAPGVETTTLEAPRNSDAPTTGGSGAEDSTPGSPPAPASLAGSSGSTKATPATASLAPSAGLVPSGVPTLARSATPLSNAPSSKVDTSISTTSAQPLSASGAASPSAPPEPPRVAGPGESTIRLGFRAAAWVEITDAFGKVLLSRTHPGGSNAEVVGRPPFNIVIGNSAEVRLTYNGREIDLAPHTRVAVARFTLP